MAGAEAEDGRESEAEGVPLTEPLGTNQFQLVPAGHSKVLILTGAALLCPHIPAGFQVEWMPIPCGFHGFHMEYFWLRAHPFWCKFPCSSVWYRYARLVLGHRVAGVRLGGIIITPAPTWHTHHVPSQLHQSSTTTIITFYDSQHDAGITRNAKEKHRH